MFAGEADAGEVGLELGLGVVWSSFVVDWDVGESVVKSVVRHGFEDKSWSWGQIGSCWILQNYI